VKESPIVNPHARHHLDTFTHSNRRGEVGRPLQHARTHTQIHTHRDRQTDRHTHTHLPPSSRTLIVICFVLKKNPASTCLFTSFTGVLQSTQFRRQQGGKQSYRKAKSPQNMFIMMCMTADHVHDVYHDLTHIHTGDAEH